VDEAIQTHIVGPPNGVEVKLVVAISGGYQKVATLPKPRDVFIDDLVENGTDEKRDLLDVGFWGGVVLVHCFWCDAGLGVREHSGIRPK